MREEIKIEINGKQIVIREFAIEDILMLWDKIRILEKNQSLVEQVQKIAVFARELLPIVTDLDQKWILSQGFSVLRKIWNAFLEVNRDFLWILDSLGIIMIVTAIKQEAKKESMQIIMYIIEAIKSDMKRILQQENQIEKDMESENFKSK